MPHVTQAATSLELDLSRTSQVEALDLGNGVYSVETKGNDPWVMCKPIDGGYDPDEQSMLSFDYVCAKGLDSLEVHYGPPIVAKQYARGPAVLSSEGWTSYAFSIKDKQEPGSWIGGHTLFRLDFGRKPGCVIQVRNIQLRAPTAYELELLREDEATLHAREEFELKLQGFVTQQYSVVIEQVKATADTIVIAVNATDEASNLYLCEVPVYQTPVGRTEFVWQQPLQLKAGRAAVEVPRFRPEGKAMHDRLYSSWIVMRRNADVLEAASHQRFVDEIPRQWQLVRDRPLSKKGTVGMKGGSQFQFDDYKALGIHNCTKNIVLNRLVRLKPGKDTVPHVFNGRTYHLKQDAVRGLDLEMRKMDELKTVVSAIILIGKNTLMTHPDCAPQGIWAMPNMVEQEGWNLYAASLDFLAQRYSRPDRKYGRITHWILHNEVDAGWIWTNAGEKPLHTYFDLYYRSMRTAHCIARKYGVAGNVLISLTHNWTSAHNHLCYQPKDMIDLLAKRSSLEGDFDWGVAYHPYPQNLRNPRTWEDTDATFSFETKLITPRNLEVLDAYMRQLRMLFNGKPRTIVLSEQGSNSRDHSEESYRDQAAGLVYTWLKLEKLDTIESYVHHRWVDAAPGREGGLLFGIRTNLPDQPDEKTRHRKKLAWEMYRLLGTDRQQEAVDYAARVIPADLLQNIPYRGEIK
jgi:hypothetical protein